MSNPSLEPKILISRLSQPPRFPDHAMIETTDPPKPPDSALADRPSSVGKLNHFPPEIMSILLGMLDVQSVSRLAAVSFLGNTLVQSQRAYRDLVTFAPLALLALGRVGLIHVHSVAELHGALRTKQCAYCVEYGAFLFLPTCERCCWDCLRYNPSLRLLQPTVAKRYFGLSDRHLEQLPTLRVVAGNYGTANRKLVSVKAAKALGLVVQGSLENLAQAMLSRCKTTSLIADGRYFQSEPTVSQDQDLLLQPWQGGIPYDKFFGVASIRFLSVSGSGEAEDGLWCLGCRRTCPRGGPGARPPPPLRRPALFKGEFLEHIKHCDGARKLVPELATAND